MLIVKLENLTTRTALHNGKLWAGSRIIKASVKNDLLMAIAEVHTDGVVLDLPERVCSEGHELHLFLSFKNFQRALELDPVARVKEVRDDTKGRARITVTFTKFDASAWQIAQQMMQAQQGFTTQLFRRLKGEG